MRWKTRYPERANVRIVRRFLFFPTWILGEYRWLEMALIKQQYVNNDFEIWGNIAWVEKKEQGLV